MINKKLTAIYERERIRRAAISKQKADEVTKFPPQEWGSLAHKKAQSEAGDARASFYAHARSDRLRNAVPGEINSHFLLDLPHYDGDLSHSKIVDLQGDTSADDLKVMNADLVTFMLGFVDSGIDLLEGTVKGNRTIKINMEGDVISVSELQDYFRYMPDQNREYHPTNKRRSIAESFSRLFIFSETQRADAMERSQKSGGARPMRPETLKERLKKWVINEWESSLWSSQEAFIKRIREPFYAPEEKAETIKYSTDAEIKSWLPPKKKYAHKK